MGAVEKSSGRVSRKFSSRKRTSWGNCSAGGAQQDPVPTQRKKEFRYGPGPDFQSLPLSKR